MKPLAKTSAYWLEQFWQLAPAWALQDQLAPRCKQYLAHFEQQYQTFCDTAARRCLVDRDHLQLQKDHAAWMDGWMLFTWQFVGQEEHAIALQLLSHGQQNLNYLEKALPAKLQAYDDLNSYLFNDKGEKNPLDPAEFAYYSNQLKEMERANAQMGQELERLRETVPLLKQKSSALPKSLPYCLFARGGYGREELSFSSDVDLAYVVAPSQLSALEMLLLQELFKRLSELFSHLPIKIASQYLELGEDFTRFHDEPSLHALPALLEGRFLLGKKQVLDQLKTEVHKALPLERVCRWLLAQQRSLAQPNVEQFDIKEGAGGLRHLHYSLWLAMIFYRPAKSGAGEMLQLLEAKGLLSSLDRKNLLQAMEFYASLRNFIGLFPRYKPQLEAMRETLLLKKKLKTDFLDDGASMAYLKLVHRFTTIDDMDRFRLFSMQQVKERATALSEQLLDRTTQEDLHYFRVFKHLGSGRILHLTPVGARHPRKSLTREAQQSQIKTLFRETPALYELFLYLAENGLQLHPHLLDALASLVPGLYAIHGSQPPAGAKEFIFRLFSAEFAHVALSQMLETAQALSWAGEYKSLLGLFLPLADEMRFLLRNVNIHAYPLCRHSLLSLERVELEAQRLRAQEPELWRFVGAEDIFALKWATFFHDLGKTNPYRDHEQLGPSLSSKMLVRLGWDENHETLDMIRLLVLQHQGVVRCSRLATYTDLGIVRYFEIADRSPRKLLLLYLVNLADFMSVNPQMEHQAGQLKSFFQKSIEILSEFKQSGGTKTLNDIVEGFLDQKIAELKHSVILEMVLKQCGIKNLKAGLFDPLAQIAPAKVEPLLAQKQQLHAAVHFISLGELDPKSLAKHRQNFYQTLNQHLSQEELLGLLGDAGKNLDWFFTSLPNRYLLEVDTEVLCSQLIELHDFRSKPIRFSHLSGGKDHFDHLLFTGMEDLNLHSKIAYVLGRSGANIENGKINHVLYHNGKEGLVGFFQYHASGKSRDFSLAELENQIAHLKLPNLDSLGQTGHNKTNVQIQFIPEHTKAYLVREHTPNRFSRERVFKVACKISLFDQPFCYFKMMASLEAMKVTPSQVTITTIGKQIIDYFYIEENDVAKLDDPQFEELLQGYLHADLTKVNPE